jgi:hypothetical protein
MTKRQNQERLELHVFMVLFTVAVFVFAGCSKGETGKTRQAIQTAPVR